MGFEKYVPRAQASKTTPQATIRKTDEEAESAGETEAAE